MKYHLAKNCDVDPFATKRLSNSFFVDNLLTSVHNESELRRLINVSNELVKKGDFELRDWESSAPTDFRELEALKEVRVPRWISITPDATKKYFIHTFCKASKDAYAAVSYLLADDKNVHFLAYRSRIAPLKGAAIPRLELLAALVGGRLTKSIVDALGWTTVKCFYWSDSTTVLTGITKEENWSVFVNNRVQEIRKISQPSSWCHVSGVENPADLPSRGYIAPKCVTAPLPEDRVRNAAVFQIAGIDTAGPLFLKDNQKVWVLLFICAVFKAVQLELMSGVSTEAFLMALRRFVARRGRCSTIYCDNGTNFVDAANILRSLDWKKVIKYGTVNAVDWKFNTPTAEWWERLIRIMKDILKRVLGKAYLSHEEMTIVLCDCEAIINSRPLTLVSENDTPISPSMFIQDMGSSRP
ncbi:hypothetical protein AVEN_105036-1 [Araneus ventricosus]|uniref:Integrase catalytic domain-containing protein n=1 Tax=Araneus ventricosus TaxID=182803 RepID=A0A4Y2MY59_ARAVE|nr:hypothetical protein AVEN_105036-1 [Araneus ventricosus]